MKDLGGGGVSLLPIFLYLLLVIPVKMGILYKRNVAYEFKIPVFARRSKPKTAIKVAVKNIGSRGGSHPRPPEAVRNLPDIGLQQRSAAAINLHQGGGSGQQ